jgi:dTDP-4-amino-4,6-dideoxygalactose transaminase
LYTVRIEKALFGRSSRDALRALAELKIQTRPLWQPLHQSPAHIGSECLGGDVAKRLFGQGLSLPCSVGITPEEQDRVITGIMSQRNRTGK